MNLLEFKKYLKDKTENGTEISITKEDFDQSKTEELIKCFDTHPDITSIKIIHCVTNPDNIKLLAPSIAKLTKLTEFWWNHTSIGNTSSAITLCDALTNCTNLKGLSFHDTHINGIEMVKSISNLLIKLKSLEIIWLSQNKGMGNDIVENLAGYLPSMTNLRCFFTKCTSLSNEKAKVLLEIIKICGSIKHTDVLDDDNSDKLDKEILDQFKSLKDASNISKESAVFIKHLHEMHLQTKDQLRKEKEEQKSTISTLQKKYNSVKKSSLSIKRKFEDTSNKLSEVKGSLKKLQSELTTKDSLIAKLQESSNDKDQQLENQKAKISNLSDQIQTTQKSIETLQQKSITKGKAKDSLIAKLQESSNDKDQQLENQKAKISNLEDQVLGFVDVSSELNTPSGTPSGTLMSDAFQLIEDHNPDVQHLGAS